MDLVTDLPTSASGNDTIVVFVDRLTKMVHFAPTTKTVTAPLMARIFVDTIYKHHGMPKTIISDRDPRFTSHFWRATWTLLGTTLKMSTTAHPQTDGQTERANRVLAEMLRSYIHPKQDDWEEYLPMLEFAYNDSTQRSSQHSPFYLNYGRHLHNPMTRSVPPGRMPAARNFLRDQQAALERAKVNLGAAQKAQAAYANTKRRHATYDVGNMVYLSTQNLRLAYNPSDKLRKRFTAPFKILAHLTGQLPPGAAQPLENSPRLPREPAEAGSPVNGPHTTDQTTTTLA